MSAEAKTKEALLAQIADAGVVGCGGAGFPAHVKYAATAGRFIVNGAECEPLLRTDRWLMRHEAPRLVQAAARLGALVGAGQTAIALKKTYGDEIAALEAAIGHTGVPVELMLLDNFYPAGDEQMIVLEATGEAVPPAGIPIDGGAVVGNVATTLACADAFEGVPLTHRLLTVTGAVARPVLLRVPTGTPVLECVALAGGATGEGWSLVLGGPMMGRVVSREEAESEVVAKTTSGLIVVPAGSHMAARGEIRVPRMVNQARAACIQCSFCTQLCPRYLAGHPLEPHRIMRRLAYAGSIEALAEDEDMKQALLCCECGICEEFACPMALKPRTVNAMLKAIYAKEGVRWPKGEGAGPVHPERENRKAPSKKVAARLGLMEWYGLHIEDYIEHTPARVAVPLKQHTGAPAQAVVKPGDTVAPGQRIGACPPGALGAHVHAGIGGVVAEVTDRVVIEGTGGEGA